MTCKGCGRTTYGRAIRCGRCLDVSLLHLAALRVAAGLCRHCGGPAPCPDAFGPVLLNPTAQGMAVGL